MNYVQIKMREEGSRNLSLLFIPVSTESIGRVFGIKKNSPTNKTSAMH